jgi:hypothetical protein
LSAGKVGRSASAAPGRRAVPAQARVVAGRLAALFGTDQQIVRQLNDAQRRLRAANDRLSAGRVLEVGAVHWQIHGAFCDYQHAAEQRRQLAVDVGELSHQLTDLLQAAGWSIEQARSANVHQLATATTAGPAADDHPRTRSRR